MLVFNWYMKQKPSLVYTDVQGSPENPTEMKRYISLEIVFAMWPAVCVMKSRTLVFGFSCWSLRSTHFMECMSTQIRASSVPLVSCSAAHCRETCIATRIGWSVCRRTHKVKECWLYNPISKQTRAFGSSKAAGKGHRAALGARLEGAGTEFSGAPLERRLPAVLQPGATHA